MVKMFASERRTKILEYLNKKNRVTVKELSEILNVTKATLRTDLASMEKEGYLQRTHGGAILQENAHSEYSFSVREKTNLNEKIEIANLAATFVQDGHCILLDASSTALELAKILKKRQIRLTVLTNGIYSALELKENPEITVILLGGVLRVGSNAVEGTLGTNILEKINVYTMFTSAYGFTYEDGLMDFNVYEVELKKSMVASSARVVALLDHSKLGKSSISSFASTQQIHTLITDSNAPADYIEKLIKQNVNVITPQIK